MPYFTYSGKPLPDYAVNKCKPTCPYPSSPPPPPPQCCPPTQQYPPSQRPCSCCAPIVPNPKPPLPGFDYTPRSAMGDCPSCSTGGAGGYGGMALGTGMFRAGDLMQGMSGMAPVSLPVDSKLSSDYSDKRASRRRKNRTLMEDHPSLLIDNEKVSSVVEEDVKAQPRKKLRKTEPVCTDCCQNLMLAIGEGMETTTSGSYEISLYDHTLKRGSMLEHEANTAHVRVKESGRYRIALSGRFIAEDPDNAHGAVGAHIELQDQSRRRIRVLDAANFVGEITRDEFTAELRKNDVLRLVWQLEEVNQTVGLAEPVLFIEKLPEERIFPDIDI